MIKELNELKVKLGGVQGYDKLQTLLKSNQDKGYHLNPQDIIKAVENISKVATLSKSQKNMVESFLTKYTVKKKATVKKKESVPEDNIDVE